MTAKTLARTVELVRRLGLILKYGRDNPSESIFFKYDGNIVVHFANTPLEVNTAFELFYGEDNVEGLDEDGNTIYSLFDKDGYAEMDVIVRTSTWSSGLAVTAEFVCLEEDNEHVDHMKGAWRVKQKELALKAWDTAVEPGIRHLNKLSYDYDPDDLEWDREALALSGLDIDSWGDK